MVYSEVPKLEVPIVLYRTIDSELTFDYYDKGYISTTTNKYQKQE